MNTIILNRFPLPRVVSDSIILYQIFYIPLFFALLLIIPSLAHANQNNNPTISEVSFGAKTWMVENLNVKLDDSVCYQNNEALCQATGRLYTWDSAKNACSSLGSGWHLPNDNDWLELTRAQGGAVGDKGDGLNAYKALATDTRFNGKLGGKRLYFPNDQVYYFYDHNTIGYYWADQADPQTTDRARIYTFRSTDAKILRESAQKLTYMSARCVKNNTSTNASTPKSTNLSQNPNQDQKTEDSSSNDGLIFSGWDETTPPKKENPADAAPKTIKSKLEGTWRLSSFNFEKNSKYKDPYFSGKKDIRNSNYTTPDYYVFSSLDDTGMKVSLRMDSIEGKMGIYLSTDGKKFNAVKPIASINSLELSTSRNGTPRIKLDNRKVLIKPRASDANLERQDDEVKSSSVSDWLFGSTPIGISYSYLGYDITKVNPWNLTTHSSPKQIFRSSATVDYAFKDRKIIPYGLYYKQDLVNETVYTETAISSEKEMQESSRSTFGMGVSPKGKPGEDPKEAAGFNYVNEKSKGMRESGNEMKAYGLAYIHEYALVLDKGLMRLSLDFEDGVHDLKTGYLTPTEFITRFGTHYPHAVTYGAMAKSEMTFTQEDYANFTTETNGFDASVTIPAKAADVKIKGGHSVTKSSKDSSSSTVRFDTFSGVGGSGSWGKEGFTANPERIVPILYDLRPIYELLSPVYFNDDDILIRVRNNLSQHWLTYLNGFKLSSISTKPNLYKISVTGFRCINDGGEAHNDGEYYGKIMLMINNGKKSKTITLMNRTEDNSIVLAKCGKKGTLSKALNKSDVIVVSQKHINTASFSFNTESFYDSDSSPDKDEVMLGFYPMKLVKEAVKNKKYHFDINGIPGPEKARVYFKVEKLN